MRRHGARGWRCRENRASRPWRAPALRTECVRISGWRRRRRALRFHWPSCFLAVSAQGRRADSGFQAGCGRWEAAMPNVVYKRYWSVTFPNGAHERLLETPVRPDAVPQGATRPGAPGHGCGCRRVRARHGTPPDAAAMDGADVAHCYPDERLPIFVVDPRLYAGDRGRRDLWRCHRGAYSAFPRERDACIVGGPG